MNLKEIQAEVHSLAKEKGWWDSPRRTEVEIYMLIASEVFEALEDVRNNQPSKYYEDSKPCGSSIELADTVIRIMDYCEYRGWDLEALIKEKHEFNKTRPYKHGNKKL